jgi:pSer/pThr/pTyr-binding forkhead associated (FHA) protein
VPEDPLVLHRLSVLVSQLLADREALARSVSWPVLVWEGAPSQPVPVPVSVSVSVPRTSRPTVSGLRSHARSVEPVVYELRPRLPVGDGRAVTVGRGPECDIVLSEPTVSRMHARFRQEPHTGVWSVTDLESHNGTYVEGVLIVPGRPAPLFRNATLRLGSVEVRFLQAEAFTQYVRAHSLPPPVRLTPGR